MSGSTPVFRSAAALRKALAKGRGSVGFVPTMGALHEGHLSLVRRARRGHGRVVVSIFVNPTQFGPNEDFAVYPRDLEGDRRLLAGAGGALVYAPDVADVYPEGFCTTVKVGGTLGTVLEAAHRPGHFDGVATVVSRLFFLVRPDAAYFGLKDYQQFRVVGRMTADLGFGPKLVGCPIVRESDGLAMSSRNRRLDARARAAAPGIHRALAAMAAKSAAGERSVPRLKAAGLRALAGVEGLKVQYLEVADPEGLEPLKRLSGPAIALFAGVLGGVRLIDNQTLLTGRE
jgi:pantoate--beta-alanine ligase